MAYDFFSGLGGAGTGALYGASAGGPIGAIVGGGIGALGGFFSGDKSQKKISTFDPHQKQLFEQSTQALQGNGGPLADIYGQFDPQMMRDYYEKSYSQPQYQEFRQNIVPGITGAFRGQNLQNSSYLGGALSSAGTSVQNDLNAQMAKMLYEGQQSSLNRRSNALQSILSMQTHVNERPGPSIFDNLLNSLSSNAGGFLADMANNRKSPGIVESTPPTTPTSPGVGG